MTKSRQSGENEITRQADREAARTKRHVCDILADMLAKAQADGDLIRIRKIIRAQKYGGCRNIRKRRSRR
jgi:hypothetical protein